MEKKPLLTSGFENRFLPTTLFLTGSAILVIEIIGSRLLSPFFGVGLYVWSALITITLMALALGYWLGGRWADRNPSYKQLYFLILLAGFAVLFIPSVAPYLLPMTSDWEIRFGTLVSGAVLLGPSLLLLGMITPYAVKLNTPELGLVGRRTGTLYAISTVGSCFGSLLAGFFLIPYFGVQKILYLISLLLILIWIFSKLPIFKKNPLKLILPFFLYLLIAWMPQRARDLKHFSTLYKTDSLYGELLVIERGEKRHLLIDGAPNAGINKVNGFSLYPYTYYFELIPLINPLAKEALVIGLGGGSLVHRLRDYQMSVDVVEIDRAVLEIAKRYFYFQESPSQVFIEDARHYIRRAHKKYDVIILDVFNGDLAPMHLFTKESLQEMKGILSDEGILGINYIGFTEGPDSQVPRSILRTLQAVFPYTDVYLQDQSERIKNMVFFTSLKSLNRKEPLEKCSQDWIREILKNLERQRVTTWKEDSSIPTLVLTDDFNPIQVWNRKAAYSWRKQIQSHYQ